MALFFKNEAKLDRIKRLVPILEWASIFFGKKTKTEVEMS